MYDGAWICAFHLLTVQGQRLWFYYDIYPSSTIFLHMKFNPVDPDLGSPVRVHGPPTPIWRMSEKLEGSLFPQVSLLRSRVLVALDFVIPSVKSTWVFHNWATTCLGLPSWTRLGDQRSTSQVLPPLSSIVYSHLSVRSEKRAFVYRLPLGLAIFSQLCDLHCFSV